MSTAEWNVLGLTMVLVGLLLLFRVGLPGAEQRRIMLNWFGLVLLIAGTACQIWANVRWVT